MDDLIRKVSVHETGEITLIEMHTGWKRFFQDFESYLGPPDTEPLVELIEAAGYQEAGQLQHGAVYQDDSNNLLGLGLTHRGIIPITTSTTAATAVRDTALILQDASALGRFAQNQVNAKILTGALFTIAGGFAFNLADNALKNLGLPFSFDSYASALPFMLASFGLG